MNHLPKYWCVKIETEHPLWKKFCESIEKKYPAVNSESSWDYIGFDGSGSAGYNMATEPYNFCKQTKLITLEEYFTVQYEIY